MDDEHGGRIKVTTKTGDDGTTGLLFGGRVRKDDVIIEAVGAVDEAQAAIGLARAFLKTAGRNTTISGIAAGGDVARKSTLSTRDSSNAAGGNTTASEDAVGADLDALLVHVERDLWVLMAEVSGFHRGHDQLVPEKTCVTEAMVSGLETASDVMIERLQISKGFAVPGESVQGALLDNARVAVRKAERRVVAAALGSDTQAEKYLNRLSDLLWILARLADGESLMAEESR